MIRPDARTLWRPMSEPPYPGLFIPVRGVMRIEWWGASWAFVAEAWEHMTFGGIQIERPQASAV